MNPLEPSADLGEGRVLVPDTAGHDRPQARGRLMTLPRSTRTGAELTPGLCLDVSLEGQVLWVRWWRGRSEEVIIRLDLERNVSI